MTSTTTRTEASSFSGAARALKAATYALAATSVAGSMNPACVGSPAAAGAPWLWLNRRESSYWLENNLQWVDAYGPALGWRKPQAASVRAAMESSSEAPLAKPTGAGTCLRAQGQHIVKMGWLEHDRHTHRNSYLRDRALVMPEAREDGMLLSDWLAGQEKKHMFFPNVTVDAAPLSLAHPVGCGIDFEAWVIEDTAIDHAYSILHSNRIDPHAVLDSEGRVRFANLGAASSDGTCTAAVAMHGGVAVLRESRVQCMFWADLERERIAAFRELGLAFEASLTSFTSIMCDQPSTQDRFTLAVEDIRHQRDRVAFLLGYFGPLAQQERAGRRMGASKRGVFSQDLSLLMRISAQHNETHTAWVAAKTLLFGRIASNEL